MKHFNTAEEITKAFIAAGWSDTTAFTEATENGRKVYKMNNGNTYDSSGKLLYFNIPTASENARRTTSKPDTCGSTKTGRRKRLQT